MLQIVSLSIYHGKNTAEDEHTSPVMAFATSVNLAFGGILWIQLSDMLLCNNIDNTLRGLVLKCNNWCLLQTHTSIIDYLQK